VGAPFREGVRKVAGVQDECVLARLDEVGSNLVPAERTGARDQERLRRGRNDYLARVVFSNAAAITREQTTHRSMRRQSPNTGIKSGETWLIYTLSSLAESICMHDGDTCRRPGVLE
jgi:hypothetical protein